jgi:hypothetical protein
MSLTGAIRMESIGKDYGVNWLGVKLETAHTNLAKLGRSEVEAVRNFEPQAA